MHHIALSDHLCGQKYHSLFLFQGEILYAELLTNHYVEFWSEVIHETTLRGEGQFAKVYFSVYDV